MANRFGSTYDYDEDMSHQAKKEEATTTQDPRVRVTAYYTPEADPPVSYGMKVVGTTRE